MTSRPIARSTLTLVRAHVAARGKGPIPQESDEALVLGVRAGDGRCKTQLYLRHVQYIAGMSARMLRSIELSEDVVQDTFVIAFSRIDALRDPSAFRGWLASIAVSQIHRRLARSRLLRVLGLERARDDDVSLDSLARDDVSAEVRCELAALDVALQTLPREKRIAWMLRHVEGEKIDAVAEACGCSRATVKRWIASADELIKRHVDIETTEDLDD